MARNEQTSQMIDDLINISLRAGSLEPNDLLAGLLEIADTSPYDEFTLLDTDTQLREVRTLRDYILRQGLLDVEYDTIILTSKGKRRIYRRELETAQIKPQKPWDEHWRLVFFDIPADSRVVRSTFIRQLRRLGLQPFQQSVWVHPYPCMDQINTLADAHGIREHVTYVEASYINDDYALRSQFTHLLS